MVSLKLITLAIFKRFWQNSAALNCGKTANLTFFSNYKWRYIVEGIPSGFEGKIQLYLQGNVKD